MQAIDSSTTTRSGLAVSPLPSALASRAGQGPAHRHDGQGVRKVRRVLQQPPALVQRFKHELQLAVVEVKHGLL